MKLSRLWSVRSLECKKEGKIGYRQGILPILLFWLQLPGKGSG